MRGVPLSDRILVRTLKQAEEVAAIPGFTIEQDPKERPLRGEVLAVGPGRILETGALVPMTLKQGDLVMYGKYSGMEVKIGTETLLVMSEPDVMLKLVD